MPRRWLNREAHGLEPAYELADVLPHLAPGGILADLFDVAMRDPELALAYARFTAGVPS